MQKPTKVFMLLFCLITFPTSPACRKGDAPVVEAPQLSPDETQRSDTEEVPANVSNVSDEVGKMMAELRLRFADKTDDEIVQVLRRYAPPDQSGVSDGMKWFTEKFHRAAKQRKAVEAIKNVNGGIFYDCQEGSGICRPAGNPRAPASLRRLLSDHFFTDVIGVGLSGEDVANENLASNRS
jgi:hypothetical protein